MCARWNDLYNPQIIIDALNKIKTINKDGNVSFTGFEFQEYITVLSTSIIFSKELPRSLVKSILSDSIFSVAKEDNLSLRGLIAEISKRENAYLKKEPNKYFLLSDISLKYFHPLKRIKIKDYIIIFRHHLPEDVKREREKFLDWAQHHIHGRIPSLYIFVQVYSEGRSPQEAGVNALDALNLLRSIWNLFFNYSRGIRMSSGKRRAVNKIVLGPLQSLHHINNKIALDSFWYDPEYNEPIDCKDIESNWSKLRKFEKGVRSRLKSLATTEFGTIIENALLRYVHALDERNFDSCFLKLWSLLELLTGTQSDSYKVTIKRAAALFFDYNFHLEVLQHLRDWRNRTVHSGEQNNDIEVLMYQLKRYVESLLMFYIFNSHRFKNKEEMIELFDLAPNKERLFQKKRLIEMSLKYFHKPEEEKKLPNKSVKRETAKSRRAP